MFLRKNLVLTASLFAVVATGVSSFAIAADTKPLVPETCVRTTLATPRHGGPAGKSLVLPVRARSESVPCVADARKPLILASFTDAKGGQSLVDGRTERALEQIGAMRSVRRTSAELTNLCVAHTVLRQWSEASAACDAAVARALDMRADAGYRFSSDRRSADQGAGAALSNRAVLHWLSGETVAAHNDLARARDFLPGASFVAQNLEVAVGQPSLARVQVGGSSSR